MFRLWQTEHGKWKWEIRANNHVVMLTSSQAHPTYESAQAEINAVNKWARTKYKPMNSINYVERHGKTDTPNEFVVMEKNKVIGKSKSYQTTLSCYAGALLAVELCKSRETLVLRSLKK